MDLGRHGRAGLGLSQWSPDLSDLLVVVQQSMPGKDPLVVDPQMRVPTCLIPSWWLSSPTCADPLVVARQVLTSGQQWA